MAKPFDPLDFTTTGTVVVKDNGDEDALHSTDHNGKPLSFINNDAFEAWFSKAGPEASKSPEGENRDVVVLTTTSTAEPAIMLAGKDVPAPASRKSSTQLLREASRMEALAFMPQIGGILSHPAVGLDLKIKLFDRLMAYGIGPKNTAKGDNDLSVKIGQMAVIALPPRVSALDLLPLASPLLGGDELPTVPLRPSNPISDRAQQLLAAGDS